MGNKRKGGRRRPRRHRRKQPESAGERSYDWEKPLPELRAEDRLSTVLDYRDIVSDYESFAAEVGRETLQEQLDIFYFLLAKSARLLDEPEFSDAEVSIDPHDFLVFETADVLLDTLDDDQDVVPPQVGTTHLYDHILFHAMRRYLTPELRADLGRRAGRVARRRDGTAIGSMADAVEVALDDEGISVMVITLLLELFSESLIRRLANQEKRFEQEWENRDQSLDPWMEQIASADFDRPAEQAVEELVAAGPRALPHLAHLFYNMELSYDDYSVTTALETFARIPSQLSLHVLVQALLDDHDWSTERAAELLADLPDLVCPYLKYALTVPGGPDWAVGLWGYDLLGQAQCPGSFDLLQEGLTFEGEWPYESEDIQLSAAEGLVTLGDERAIPLLHDFLRDPQAQLPARSELLYVLSEAHGEHPWAAEIVGDLTYGTLPEAG